MATKFQPSPRALELQKWFQTSDFIRAADPSTLGPPGGQRAVYLRHRLEKAFLAGMEAGERIAAKELKAKPEDNTPFQFRPACG